MEAIRIEEPKRIEFIEIDEPVAKEGEAILKILYGGICGTDLGSYRGNFAYFDYPRVPGHEFSAEIVSIGENEYGLKKGMIVTCNPYFNCEECYSCKKGLVNACMDNQTMGVQREGAFTRYISMPIERIYDGKGLSPKLLAIIEPFCIGWHGIKRSSIKKGDKVLVVGSGTIGVFAALSAKILGADVYVSDVDEKKLNYVNKNFKFKGTILNSSKEDFDKSVADITNGNGFDITIEAVGLPQTFQDCMDAACFGGDVVVIGVGKKNLDFNFTIVQKKELNIYGSRNALKEDFLNLIDVVSENPTLFEKVITHIYPFEKAKEAFRDFDENKELILKILIDFTK